MHSSEKSEVNIHDLFENEKLVEKEGIDDALCEEDFFQNVVVEKVIDEFL